MTLNNYVSFSVSDADVAHCIANIDAFDAMRQSQVREAVAETTYLIETAAKRSAPVAGKGKFGGFLRSRIFSQISASGYGGRVWAAAPYAPYQEFGTGALVDVPEGFEDFALQFKGKGIRRVNIRAKHFLFYAFELEMPEFIRRVRNIFGVKQ
jgi:hypothetical protein